MQIFFDRINLLYKEAKTKNPKLKCRDFANLCGVRDTQMHNWLNLAGMPNAETLRTIAEHLNINVAWLIGLSELRYNFTDALSLLCQTLPSQEIEELKIYIDYLKFKRNFPKK